MLNKIAFLTEGGGELGLGHVMRSITLAKKFPRSKVRFFLTHRSTLMAEHIVRSSGFPISYSLKGVDLVIRDLSGGARAGEHDFPGTMMIDIVDEAHEVGFSATYGFSFMGEPFSCEKQIFSGFDYAILRDSFFRYRKQGPSKKTGPVVVSLGGVDPSGSTPLVLAGLSHLTQGPGIVGIIGPGYRGPWVPGLVACSPDSLVDYLYHAPLVVSSGGMTVLECAALGAPTLVVAHNEKEDRRAKILSSFGFFHYLGKSNTLDLDSIKWHANHVLTDVLYASTMQSIGWAMVDGRGAERVISFINNNIGEYITHALT